MYKIIAKKNPKINSITPMSAMDEIVKEIEAMEFEEEVDTLLFLRHELFMRYPDGYFREGTALLTIETGETYITTAYKLMIKPA